MKPGTPRTARARSRLRVIGGKWRGRPVEFSAAPGLRPTPDRVRETLFNWLQAYTEGSRCLDLFAGSGALSLEALSRGASSVTAIDQSAAALGEIRRNLERLGGGDADLVLGDALAWLERARGIRFDIVFLDPPFSTGLAAACLRLLGDSDLLSPRAWIYLELPAATELPPLPPGWRLHREKRAGDVSYRLLQAA